MKYKKLFITLLKITIASFGILAVFYFGNVKFKKLLDLFSNLKLTYYSLSLVLVSIIIIYSTLRWKLLLEASNQSVSFRKLVSMNYISCFFNLFLPSSFGGDFIRTVYLNKEIRSWRLSISSVFLDRFMGILSLFFLAIISLLIKTLVEKNINQQVSGFLFTGAVLTFLILFVLTKLHKILEFFVGLNHPLIKKYLTNYEQFSENINLSKYSRKIILKSFAISIISNLISAVSIYFITKSLNLYISLYPILIIFPLVTVISMIPLSIGGIGFREGAFTFLLAGYSVSATDALAISVLYFSTIVFLGIIGGVVFSFSKYSLKMAISVNRTVKE